MLELNALPRTDRIPLEAECISPDRMIGLSVGEIEKLPVYLGNRETQLADHFRIAGDSSDGQIQISGDCSTVKWIGAHMSRGKIQIEGDVSMHLGSEMQGGEIHLRGNAGEWVGAEMRGGRIHIQGDAGDRVGSSYIGSPVGMTGGAILVEGNVGTEAGSAMRRGFIAVGGAAGDFAGVSMIAGSIFVFGKPGSRYGAGMRRGTIALFGLKDEPKLLPTFRFACEYKPTFLSLYLNMLRDWGFGPTQEFTEAKKCRAYRGDFVELGKGEILAIT